MSIKAPLRENCLRDFRPGMIQNGWKSENMFADDGAQIGTKEHSHVHERPTDRAFVRGTICATRVATHTHYTT